MGTRPLLWGLGAALALYAAPQTANAAIISGTYNIPSGIVYGTTIGGVDGQGYCYDPTTLGAYDGSVTGVGNGNALDYYWVQDASGPFNTPDTGTIWDLHGQANQVVVFPIADHGPLPEEAWEYNVYLSNDLVNWTPADLIDAYDQGWDPNPAVADAWTTVWQLPSLQTARYVSVTSGNNGLHGGSYYDSYDDEIDAVAGLDYRGNPVVPEPGSLALIFGASAPAALFALRRLRRRK